MRMYLMKLATGVALSACLASCAGKGEGDDAADPSLAYTQPANLDGRLLASNCFQCHGTGGVAGFDSIRGSEAHEIREFLSRPAASNIMAAHAQGYTPRQIDLIISYLSQR